MLLLAQRVIPKAQDRASIKDITEAWNGRTAGGAADYQWLIAVLGVVVVLVVLLSLQQRLRRDGLPRPGWWVWGNICRRLRLTLRDRRLLKAIARQQKLATPLTLVICRATLLEHGRAYLAQLPDDAKRPAADARLQAIADTLFPEDDAITLAVAPDVLT